ncbi:inositol monophosphatase family protein [Shumkonia mesophila]|uniref:inositol monophosphatase family protein n=1 Tax=Shumkonia mesophila TaxID=2838854 RepID=UPI002934F933|nr:inositol monophosphatase [Shumkonia mesophila]
MAMPTAQDLEGRVKAACRIAEEAAALGLRYFRDGASLAVTAKGVQDVVSNADRDIEALVRGRLAAQFPGDAFFGEESGRGDGADPAAGVWVVDPIDGTDNFVRGIAGWCVSIAFVVGREVEIGVICDPLAGELYLARRGIGATLNGVPLKPRRVGGFRDGIVGMGYSLRRPPEPTLKVFAGLLAAQGMYQRTGSGALMIAYVASGRYIGYYEAHINAWDCLAGVALVREAGGWTSDFLAGDGLHSGNALAAAAPGLEDAMRRLTGLD